MKCLGYELGSEKMSGKNVFKGNRKIKKICFLGLITLSTISIDGHIFVGQFLMGLVYPGKDTAKHSANKGAAFLKNFLFPGAAFICETDEDMIEKLNQENSNYKKTDQENQMENSQHSIIDENQIKREEGILYSAKNDIDVHNLLPEIDEEIYNKNQIYDMNYIKKSFYVVDSSTYFDTSIIEPYEMIERDMSLSLSGNQPKILIYHTHSQESFADSDGSEYGTVVGLGTHLASILSEKYGVSTYHLKESFDVVNGKIDRSSAYTNAISEVEKILESNPTIEVVIDLHRDGVKEGTHLVTTINNKKTAKIMFFNGLCRNKTSELSSYTNPYLKDNLALSFQLGLISRAMYPELLRCIYLHSYRYNMHFMPRSILIECGAQTNTVEEAHNAMEPLADILYAGLSGEISVEQLMK